LSKLKAARQPDPGLPISANPRNLMGFLVSFKAILPRKQANAHH
jgi:hypothetical protein